MNSAADRCTRCNHTIRPNPHNKCLYCGEPIPPHLSYSDDERRALIQAKDGKYQQQKHEREKAQRSSDWGMDIGAAHDGGGFCGDGGCGGDA